MTLLEHAVEIDRALPEVYRRALAVETYPAFLPGYLESRLLRQEKERGLLQRKALVRGTVREWQSWVRFDPERSIDYADALLAEVMSARGYPVSDFDQRAGDISVDHPNVVQHYRAGHDIAVRHSRGEAGTDELRQALIHYRSLFEELVTERQPAPEPSH